MEKLTRKVMETYYKIKCDRCGVMFESNYSCFTKCNKCKDEISKKKTNELKSLLTGSHIISIDNRESELLCITIKTKGGKVFKIDHKSYMDDEELNYEETKL